jgi:hypothetical protein
MQYLTHTAIIKRKKWRNLTLGEKPLLSNGSGPRGQYQGNIGRQRRLLKQPASAVQQMLHCG